MEIPDVEELLSKLIFELNKLGFTQKEVESATKPLKRWLKDKKDKK